MPGGPLGFMRLFRVGVLHGRAATCTTTRATWRTTGIELRYDFSIVTEGPETRHAAKRATRPMTRPVHAVTWPEKGNDTVPMRAMTLRCAHGLRAVCVQCAHNLGSGCAPYALDLVLTQCTVLI